jgi:hypothetical protein
MTTKSRRPVGYGSPPVETRFRAGQSGNPKGRPKGSKTLKAIFAEELNRPVTATENGKRHMLPMSRAIIKTLVNQAARGDLRAAAFVMKLGLADQADAGQPAQPGSPTQSEQDEAILNRGLLRLRAAMSSIPDGDDE